MIREILNLIRKELLLEWKQKYAFNGLLLYVLSMVVVIAVAFKGSISTETWTIVFWIIMLFVSINAVAKSFMSVSAGQLIYLYSIARPSAIILAKLIYNLVLLLLIAYICVFAFAFLSQVNPHDMPSLLAIIALGCAALSANLTLVTAIASRAENRTTLLAVLGFPLIIPILLLLIELSNKAIEVPTSGPELNLGGEQLVMLGGMTLSLTLISVILFPFVWRE